MSWYEDHTVGREIDLGSHTFSAEEIKRFARAHDPQSFHLDEEAARQSHFGALCASGWHTAAVWMRLMVAAREAAKASSDQPPAPLGPSPGFEDLRWLKPVYAGDTIRYSMRLTEKRPLATRRGWGLITHANSGVNQRGETVITFTTHALAPIRDT